MASTVDLNGNVYLELSAKRGQISGRLKIVKPVVSESESDDVIAAEWFARSENGARMRIAAQLREWADKIDEEEQKAHPRIVDVALESAGFETPDESQRMRVLVRVYGEDRPRIAIDVHAPHPCIVSHGANARFYERWAIDTRTFEGE